METSAPQKIELPAEPGQSPAAVYEDMEYAVLGTNGSVSLIVSWRWFDGEIRQTVYAPNDSYRQYLPDIVSSVTSKTLLQLNAAKRLVPYTAIDRTGVFQVDNYLGYPFWSCRIRIGLDRRAGELLPRVVYHCWYEPSSAPPEPALTYDAVMSLVYEAGTSRTTVLVRENPRFPGLRLAAEQVAGSLGGKRFVWDEEAIAEMDEGD